jgi:hypothetical protein
VVRHDAFAVVFQFATAVVPFGNMVPFRTHARATSIARAAVARTSRHSQARWLMLRLPVAGRAECRPVSAATSGFSSIMAIHCARFGRFCELGQGVISRTRSMVAVPGRSQRLPVTCALADQQFVQKWPSHCPAVGGGRWPRLSMTTRASVHLLCRGSRARCRPHGGLPRGSRGVVEQAAVQLARGGRIALPVWRYFASS